ncbi:MAG: hypothetical protein AMXMBFR59_09480 [Rhodanobacteraceae bacterium]
MELKRISDLFRMTSPNLFVFSVVLGMATGLLYALLIPFIMYAIRTNRDAGIGLEVRQFTMFDSPTAQLAIAYSLACLGVIVIRTLSNASSEFVAANASVRHRIHIYHRIRALPIDALEKIGPSRLINFLNIDIPTITQAAMNVPSIFISSVTVLGLLAYVFFVNAHVFVFVVLALVVGIATYQLPMRFASRYFRRGRQQYDQIQEGVRGLIFGAAELKVHSDKVNAFFESELQTPELRRLRDILIGNSLFVLVRSYGQMLSFIVIGVVVFHLPYAYDVSVDETFAVVMALLYLTGPVATLLGAMGEVRIGVVALEKVQEIYGELYEEENTNTATIVPGWKTFRADDLVYEHVGDGRTFRLGPVSVGFERGQISYIVGGNGSGKTTLCKCLSLHYRPQQGSVSFDDQVIDAHSLESARQNVSTVYSNFYLFKSLYGSTRALDQAEIERYLDYLELTGKVSVVNGSFSTTALSDGQRKRLALLAALLENRDLCVFDEWAADQDPRFKETFYCTILPDLKKAGKVVIVITHDDRYFPFADQLIHMEDGRVVSVERRSNGAPVA